MGPEMLSQHLDAQCQELQGLRLPSMWARCCPSAVPLVVPATLGSTRRDPAHG